MINDIGLDVIAGQMVLIGSIKNPSKAYVITNPDENGNILVSGWRGVKTLSFNINEVRKIYK